jgi:hypothetical protein
MFHKVFPLANGDCTGIVSLSSLSSCPLTSSAFKNVSKKADVVKIDVFMAHNFK